MAMMARIGRTEFVNRGVTLAIGMVSMVYGHGNHEHSPGHGSHEHDHSHENTTVIPKMSTIATNSTTTTPRSMTEAYLYGTLSVLIVSFLSLAGVMVLPLIRKKEAYNSVMLLFMSLAVGTMTTDAVLHLIPETLGLHSHGPSDDHHKHNHDHHGHSHSTDESDKPYLGKLCVILITLYALYLLEIVAHAMSGLCKNRSAIRDATAAEKPKTPASTAAAAMASGDPGKVEGQHNSTGGVPAAKENMEMWTIAKCEQAHGHSHAPKIPTPKDGEVPPAQLICGLPPVAFVLTASDALHNFTDGLAIGAAFAKSSAAGLAVSIAVACHELPHEVGDFAILLNAGLSVKKAVLLNFVSALTCVVGVYPGIVAGQQEHLRQWIFAAVAGGFLYVALVHMLREIKEFGPLPRYLSVLLQNVGLLTGFVVVLLLAIYEDQLSSI